ncbi:MAG: sulfate adenylyltransferase [Candidatus Acidiferrales bacterium]|jgi:sulfate adenylyltransferase
MTAATETKNIAAHGGTLVNRVVPPNAREEMRARAAALRPVRIDARAASELLLIATGGFSPLEGFQTKAAAQSVVDKMSLPDGMLWPLPILLQLTPAEAGDVRVGERVVLVLDGEPLATLDVEDRFTVPADEWAPKIFGTSDAKHPGAVALRNAGEIALGGKIEWLGEPTLPGLGERWRTPAETRAEIRARGWNTVAGFQTRNPVHRAHEHVLRIALEVTDGLLLHPLVGETRAEDIPADIRMRCYQALLDNYLPQKHVLFTVLPAFMRYAGPREAIFHALVRKNFGCTHFLVGRDHAGVGGYYGPYEAHELLRSVADRGLDIQPIFFDEVFYCNRCGSMASRKTCAHPDDAHLSLSGTEVRRRLREGLPLPVEFTRPEVAAVLAEAFREPAGAIQETQRG